MLVLQERPQLKPEVRMTIVALPESNLPDPKGLPQKAINSPWHTTMHAPKTIFSDREHETQSSQ